jgi:hypothetical protein
VDIQGQCGPGTDSSHYRGTDGYLRHKTPVHNIYVDIISACLGGFSYLLAKASKIGGEN